MMQKQTRLYLQKAGILAAVYVVLRFLLPAALPFFLAWLTVAGFNSARHQIRMRLLPFSAGCLFLAGLAAFVLLGLSAWLLYQPLLDLLPVCITVILLFSIGQLIYGLNRLQNS